MSSTNSRFMMKTSVAALAMAFAFPAFAADAETEELKKLIQALEKKVEAIESRTKAPAWAGAPITNTSGVFKFYGNFDTGVETVTNVGASKGSVTRLPSKTGSTPSSLGIDLSKDVGGGIKAIGKAEMGLDFDTGTSGQGPRLFGRQIYVGIESASLGSLTFGRQYSMMLYGLMAGDLLGPNIYGLGAIDAWVPNARTDNSVAWRGKFGQVSLGGLVSFGRESSTGAVPLHGSCSGEDVTVTGACTSWSLMARYDDKDKRFGVAGAIDEQSGGSTATYSFFNGGAPAAFSSNKDTDTRSAITGFYKLDSLRLGAGWLNRAVKVGATTRKQDTTWLQADYTMGKWVFGGGAFQVEDKSVSKKAGYYVLRGIYNFDEQLSAYATAGVMDNNSNAAYSVSGGGGFTNTAGTAQSTQAGADQTGTMVGVRYRF